MPNSIQ